MSYSAQMREMLLTLQRYEELENKNLSYDPIQLDAVVQQAIRELNSSDQSIAITYPSRCPIFYADQRLLGHLFIELIRNSISNRDPEKGNLKIDISMIETQKNLFMESSDKYQYEKFVKITYTDNGEGFLTDSSLVFQILQKSAQFNKVSIGMAFCKRIVEKHMGTIMAKSVKGSGVGYTIFFPANRPSDLL
ncbi:ATP-binding protein [Flavobacterium sp. N503310]|nr:ATP-binding protein [Flavobacterium sp. N503310]